MSLATLFVVLPRSVEIAYLRQALAEIQSAKAMSKVANAQHIVSGFLSDVESVIVLRRSIPALQRAQSRSGGRCDVRRCMPS